MERGERAAKSPILRGCRMQWRIGPAMLVALFCAVAGPPAWGEPLGEKDRFAKVGGPVSENIDIDKIKILLGEAKGIGLVAKLKLRGHLTAFTEEFYKFHQGTSQKTLAQLRAEFDALHRRIVTLLTPKNPQLSVHFERSRRALWSAYSDHQSFTSTVGRDVIKEIEGDGAELVGQRYEVAR
jgi:hypothetical protein